MDYHNISISNNPIKIIIAISLIFAFIPIIGHTQAKDVITFIQKLKDKEVIVRIEGARALGEIKDLRAVSPLIDALKDEDSSVRENAAMALGKIKDTRAVGALIAALEDRAIVVRIAAAEALGEIKDASTIEPLINAANTYKEDRERKVVEESIGKIGAPAILPLIAALKRGSYADYSLIIALAKIGAPAVDPLIAALRDKDPSVRRRLSGAIGMQIKDARVVDRLIAGWRDKDLAVIAGAHHFFIRRGIQDSEPILVEALKEFGDSTMAQNFLNSGNTVLAEAGRNWARIHGYTIDHLPLGLGSGPRWGSN